jgi:hypothetical protein
MPRPEESLIILRNDVRNSPLQFPPFCFNENSNLVFKFSWYFNLIPKFSILTIIKFLNFSLILNRTFCQSHYRFLKIFERNFVKIQVILRS